MAAVEQFATRVRNAVARGAGNVVIQGTKLNKSLSSALRREGFLEGVDEVAEGNYLKYRLRFKVGRDLKPLLKHIEAFNFPGRRQYLTVKLIPRIRAGSGVVVISTTDGILTGREARSRAVGGELLLKVW